MSFRVDVQYLNLFAVSVGDKKCLGCNKIDNERHILNIEYHHIITYVAILIQADLVQEFFVFHAWSLESCARS